MKKKNIILNGLTCEIYSNSQLLSTHILCFLSHQLVEKSFDHKCIAHCALMFFLKQELYYWSFYSILKMQGAL